MTTPVKIEDAVMSGGDRPFHRRVDGGGLRTVALILVAVAVVVLVMTILDRRRNIPTPSTASPATEGISR